MGWAARLSSHAKRSDKLARLRRLTQHTSDAAMLAAASSPNALAMVHALRPHLKPAPEVTISRPDAD